MENKSKKVKVIICGGGIGGLTTAHELSRRGCDVTVYERYSIVGGLARSMYFVDRETGERYPSEYSWRVYGTEYQNLLRVLREIPLSQGSGMSIRDSLVRVCTYIFPRFDKSEVVINKKGGAIELTEDFTMMDKLKILDKLLYCVTMCVGRMDSMDSLTWKKFCRDLSPEARKYMVRMWGPVLGMDPTYMSFSVVARMVKIMLGTFTSGASCLYLMDKPTNDAWFDVWTEYLEREGGVQIKTDHEILDFEISDNNISGIKVHDKKTGKITVESADYFVCALSVESIAAMTTSNKNMKKIPEFKRCIRLAKKSRQIQLSVQYFLDQKLIYSTDDRFVIYLPDTPWALIIESEADVWDSTYSTDHRVQSVLSVGICQTDAVGIEHKKKFTACTEDEVRDEVWAQIVRSYYKSNIKTQSGDSIEQVNIVKFYMWDSFYFKDEDGGKMDTDEPKFSNNVGSLEYQPSPETSVANLFFATGYTKTQRFIYSMEAAAEAGTVAANHILDRVGLGQGKSEVFPYSSTLPIFLPLVWIDRVLMFLRLPHLSKFTFGSSLLLGIVYLLALLFILFIAVLMVFT
jgi:uncharacterized protein with NAD-binding domain and iron-sulfur cluster